MRQLARCSIWRHVLTLRAGLLPTPIDVKPTIYQQMENAIEAKKEAKLQKLNERKEAERAAQALV